MTDVYSPEKRSAVMRRVKSSATKPELAVRRLIWSLGGRYRLNRADLPGKPDIVLPGRRLAIFVHGCFWHGHDCARGARVPKANREYWVGKVGRNRERDLDARAALSAMGWRVETVWECEIKDRAALAKRFEQIISSSAKRRRGTTKGGGGGGGQGVNRAKSAPSPSPDRSDAAASSTATRSPSSARRRRNEAPPPPRSSPNWR